MASEVAWTRYADAPWREWRSNAQAAGVAIVYQATSAYIAPWSKGRAHQRLRLQAHRLVFAGRGTYDDLTPAQRYQREYWLALLERMSIDEAARTQPQQLHIEAMIASRYTVSDHVRLVEGRPVQDDRLHGVFGLVLLHAAFSIAGERGMRYAIEDGCMQAHTLRCTRAILQEERGRHRVEVLFGADLSVAEVRRIVHVEAIAEMRSSKRSSEPSDERASKRVKHEELEADVEMIVDSFASLAVKRKQEDTDDDDAQARKRTKY